MKWLDVGKQVAASGAGLLGSALAGPLVGSKVGEMISHVLGVENTPDAISLALVSDPGAAVKLKELELTHESELQNLSLKELQLQLADVQDARAQGTTVQVSEKVPWYTKTIQPILALAGMGFSFGLFLIFVYLQGKTSASAAQKDIIIYILGVLSAVVTQIMSYYFGSSSGSTKKTEIMATTAAVAAEKVVP